MDGATIVGVTPLSQTDWPEDVECDSLDDDNNYCRNQADVEIAKEREEGPDATMYTLLCNDCAADRLAAVEDGETFLSQ